MTSPRRGGASWSGRDRGRTGPEHPQRGGDRDPARSHPAGRRSRIADRRAGRSTVAAARLELRPRPGAPRRTRLSGHSPGRARPPG